MIKKVALLGAALGAVVGFQAGPAGAAVVNLTYALALNAMSVGSCPDGSCGTVKITGDTDSSLTYTVDLATGVSFHGAPNAVKDIFYFDVTGGTSRTVTGDSLTGGSGYTYKGVVSGSFVPSPGNFPGPYDYAATCQAGKGSVDPGSLCGDMFTATINGGSAAHPLVIGYPLGHGLFPNVPVVAVADLSISGSCGTATCVKGTGLVGAPEPSTWAMMALGFAGLGFAGYRKARGARTALSAA
jgi:hypothetical protein